MKKRVYFVLAWFFLGIGVIGAFVPILPTVPFLLLATVLFSKSSEKWHNWIMSHPKWGPPIQDWETKGVIRTNAKIVSTIFILVSFTTSQYFVRDRMYLVIMLLVFMLALFIFIWTRPSS